MSMSKIEEEPMLSTRQVEDEDEFDLEDNDSCSTKVSSTASFDKAANEPYGLPWPNATTKSSRKSKAQARRGEDLWTWIRWATIVSLQCIIIITILLRRREGKEGGEESESILKGKVVETGGDINGLYKTRE